MADFCGEYQDGYIIWQPTDEELKLNPKWKAGYEQDLDLATSYDNHLIVLKKHRWRWDLLIEGAERVKKGDKRPITTAMTNPHVYGMTVAQYFGLSPAAYSLFSTIVFRSKHADYREPVKLTSDELSQITAVPVRTLKRIRNGRADRGIPGEFDTNKLLTFKTIHRKCVAYFINPDPIAAMLTDLRQRSLHDESGNFAWDRLKASFGSYTPQWGP